MIVDSIRAFSLSIPFKLAFRHASAERSQTQALWVEASERGGGVGFGEGCPRAYVTAETVDGAREFVSTHRGEWLAAIRDIGTLVDWVCSHEAQINANPSAWTAVELALLDLMGKVEQKPVESLLGLPALAGEFLYTAVLGDSSPRLFEAQLNHYLQAGFQTFKIKLSGDRARDRAKGAALASAGLRSASVRADANNLWSDVETAIRDLEALDFPFWAIEEPLPVEDFEGMHRVAEALDAKIVLDESFARRDQFDHLADASDRWIVNLRVSKMGGLLRSVDLVREARTRHLPVIVGAHVGETSVLTRAALTVAANARDILLAQEGAFGSHLLESDVADPALIFGRQGILNADTLGIGRAPGLGVAISRPVRYAAALDGTSA
jgi:L-Ala-D/L-Glu epimerase